jgi:isoamylase
MLEGVITGTASRAALAVERGSSHPLGASPGPGGVNFSLFSANATGVELLLFAAHDAPEPFQIIRPDTTINKSFHFWHVLVRVLGAGTHYAFRVDGPFDPAAGHRFNRNKVLIGRHQIALKDGGPVWRRNCRRDRITSKRRHEL